MPFVVSEVLSGIRFGLCGGVSIAEAVTEDICVVKVVVCFLDFRRSAARCACASWSDTGTDELRGALRVIFLSASVTEGCVPPVVALVCGRSVAGISS